MGFKLSSLLSLADTKSNKPGMNLLHFVALVSEFKTYCYVHSTSSEAQTLHVSPSGSSEKRREAAGVSSHAERRPGCVQVRRPCSFFDRTQPCRVSLLSLMKFKKVHVFGRIPLEALDAELQVLTSRTRSVEESVQKDTELLQQMDVFLQVQTSSLSVLYSIKTSV